MDLSAELGTLIGDGWSLLCSVGVDVRIRAAPRGSRLLIHSPTDGEQKHCHALDGMCSTYMQTQRRRRRESVGVSTAPHLLKCSSGEIIHSFLIDEFLDAHLHFLS